MNRTIVMSILTAALLGCSEGSVSKSEHETAAKQVSFNTAGAPTVEFSVPDMMCEESCAKAVRETLAAQPGAVDVLVDFPNKTATVAVEEEKFDSEAALAALLDKQFSNSKLVTAQSDAEAPAAPAPPEDSELQDDESQG